MIKSWTSIRLPILTASSINLTASKMISILDRHVVTNGITLLTDDCDSTWEEFEFGFHVWKSNPERIVGFRSAFHFWNEATSSWQYSTKWTNEYSLVAPEDAFLHVQYYRLLWHYRRSVTVDLPAECDGILLNFISASIVRLPPMKVAGKGIVSCPQVQLTSCMELYRERSGCLNRLADVFGLMPLVRSSVTYNPLLYKDDVAVKRKKYPHLERAA